MSHQSFEDNIDELEDTFGLIRNSGSHAVGFVVTTSALHDSVLERITSLLASPSLDVITSPDADNILKRTTTLMHKGRSGRSEAGTTILDVARIDYEHPAMATLLQTLNMGRTLLLNSAELTVILAPDEHFGLYQELPDLFSTRSFVTRFTDT